MINLHLGFWGLDQELGLQMIRVVWSCVGLPFQSWTLSLEIQGIQKLPTYILILVCIYVIISITYVGLLGSSS